MGIRHSLTATCRRPRCDRLRRTRRPLFGSYHVLFVLVFGNGARWLLEIPAMAYQGAWDAIAAASLRSEALTMRLVRQKTTIPVPQVHAFNDAIDPDLGCAYILLEYIDGRPLKELWFDKTLAPAALEELRKRVLTEVAAAMYQLGQFTFDKGGALCYDDKDRDHFTGMGPMKMIETQIILDALKAGDHSDPSVPICGVGPFANPKDYFRSMLDRRQPTRDPLNQGIYRLLGLIIDWMPGPEPGQADSPFVLTHPDLNLQNILVDANGGLKAVIDWDGVASVPRAVGSERYPSWLTRDWDPFKYQYTDDTKCHEILPRN